MNYYKCKCGKQEYWESGMLVHDCMGCEDCQTTYAQHPDYHKDLQAHEWKIIYNQKTGKPYNICAKCYSTDKESYKKSKIIDK